jgi:hypothetical protein
MKYGETPKLPVVEACVSDKRKWMAVNIWLLKSDKTETLVLGPKKQRDLLSDLTMHLNGYTVISNKTVKDLQHYSGPWSLFWQRYQNYFKSVDVFHIWNGKCDFHMWMLVMWNRRFLMWTCQLYMVFCCCKGDC